MFCTSAIDDLWTVGKVSNTQDLTYLCFSGGKRNPACLLSRTNTNYQIKSACHRAFWNSPSLCFVDCDLLRLIIYEWRFHYPVGELTCGLCIILIINSDSCLVRWVMRHKTVEQVVNPRGVSSHIKSLDISGLFAQCSLYCHRRDSTLLICSYFCLLFTAFAAMKCQIWDGLSNNNHNLERKLLIFICLYWPVN